MSIRRLRPNSRVASFSLVVATVAVTLAACGSENSAYCSGLESASKTLGSLEAGDVESLQTGMDALHKLAKSAPTEVSGEWKVYDRELTAAEKALKDSGLKASDFESIVAGKLPRGVKASQVSEVVRAFETLKSPEVTEATDQIRKHAEAECDVTLAGVR